MKYKYTSILLFFLTTISFGQTSIKEINLILGKYQVGFKHYTLIDSTRTYQIQNEFNNQFIHRPIHVSIWYPAVLFSDTSKQLTVLNYLEILKEEEEWKNLPNEFLLDWFPYLWNTDENKKHLPEKTNAFSNTNMIADKFPVIVYAPSYQASSIENFVLFEYLASNGFIVIASPSRGTENKYLEGGTTKDMETQSKDVEFLLKEVYKLPNANDEKIALMGFSFGGLSNAITAIKNQHIKALISLDGTERYNYDVLEKSPYFNLDKLAIPYVHFAQKNIPEEILKTDKIPAELNYKFQLFDSIKYSKAYSYKFKNLTHSYFSSFGVLFAQRDKRQDKSDEEIMKSYNLLTNYTLQFLNAFLNDDENALNFIEKTPKEKGFSELITSKKVKIPIQKKFDYKDFNDLALNQNYENLIPLYQKYKEKYPDLHLQEGMLNTKALRMVFNPNQIEQGIHVFQLALYIYPNSANLYDSLGETYLLNKDYKNAKISFEKSLALNPENQNAINKIKELEK